MRASRPLASLLLAAAISTLVALPLPASASLPAPIQRLEPPFWWTGMPVTSLQIQIHGTDLGHYRAALNHPHITIAKQIAVDSPNYLFLYLEIDPQAEPGEFDISLTRPAQPTIHLPYPLHPREPTEGRHQGFDASDLIYLMMPDRFANGDPSNDSIPGMLEGVNRSDPTKRQGGDLQGIEQNLDYLQDLGMTAIWFTPIFENDMSPDYGAYHGYAATDLYRVDRRLGGNEQYKRLVQAVHARGMKVIMDMIHNHIGIEHWWMKDLPTNDWIHDLDTHGLTNFRGAIPADPHASQADRDRLLKGWFVPQMPDLNQRNELLADYLIQNTLWWIEYSGIDGIRMDTYIYPYPEYMARWAKEVLQAYPDFNIIGEAWVETVSQEAFWQYDPPGMDDGYNSHLPTVTDFPWCFAVRQGLTEDFGWQSGLMQLYYLFSQDALYADPSKNVIFLDNHDMARIYHQLGQDEALFKMAYPILLTSRGIPQVYYGTELMMGHQDRGGDDEAWRQTMPGGWPDDPRSVFDPSSRTQQERDILDYTRQLNLWRQQAQAVHHGQLTHFVPEDNTYVYFRVLPDQAVMVAINRNDHPVDLPTARFSEILQDYQEARAVPSGKPISLHPTLHLPPKTTLLLDLHQTR